MIEIELNDKDVKLLIERRKRSTIRERFEFGFFLLFFISCVYATVQLVFSLENQSYPILGFFFMLFFCIVFGLLSFKSVPTKKNQSKFLNAIIQNKKQIGQIKLVEKKIITHQELADEYVFIFEFPNFTNREKWVVDDWCYIKSNVGDNIEVEFIPKFDFFLKAKCNNINMLL